MILVVGQFRLPPEKLEQARPAMQAVMLATRAEAGCIQYSYSEDLIEPDLIRVSELWESSDHLAAHLQTAHMAIWRDQRQELGMYDRNIKFYQADGGTAF